MTGPTPTPTPPSTPTPTPGSGPRYEVLHLWLMDAALDAEVMAWARHPAPTNDGPPPPDGTDRPYRRAADALVDGWRLVQAPGPIGPDDVDGELGWEFVFERRITVG